jgi:hypothetical protein
MVKQAESLWSESRSQPHPLFENVPEARESTRARVLMQRAVAWGAGAAAVVFLLYVFWLRAAPPLLFGPLGSVGEAEQGRSLGLPSGGFLSLIEGLSQPPAERGRTQPLAPNAIGSKNDARSTESAKKDGGRTEASGSGRPHGVAAEGGEAQAYFGTEGERYGSEPRRAPGAGADDNPRDSGGGSEAENGGAPGSSGVGGDSGGGQNASDDDDDGNGNGNGGGNGNGNGGGSGNGDDDDNDEDDEDEDDEDEDDEESDDEDDEDDEDGGLF